MTPTKSTTLFVGNLSVFTTPRDLHAAFEIFGPLDVRLKPGNEGRSNCGFGFVQFASRENAEAAYAQMHGAVFMGRTIRVEWASDARVSRSGSDDVKSQPRPADKEVVQVLVSFASRKPGHRIFEDHLYQVFNRFGRIEDIAIKKSNHHQMTRNGLHSGYCFVTFPNDAAGMESAVAAVKSVNNILVNDVLYDCRLSHVLESRLQKSEQGRKLMKETTGINISEAQNMPIPSMIQIPAYQAAPPGYHSAPPTIPGRQEALWANTSNSYRAMSADTYFAAPMYSTSQPIAPMIQPQQQLQLPHLNQGYIMNHRSWYVPMNSADVPYQSYGNDCYPRVT